MELKIKNFARIKEASIKLEGMTVIAGENNTGKTTIGKILHASFNSLNNIDRKVESDITRSINRQLKEFFSLINRTKNNKSSIFDKDNIFREIYNSNRHRYINNNIARDIYNTNDEDIEQFISNRVKEYVNINDEFVIKIIKSTANKIKEYKNISKEKLSCNIISEYYNDLFYNQINSMIDENTEAEITIKDFGISFKFQNDRCLEFKKIKSVNNVFLIDSPFILDRLHHYHNYYYYYTKTASHLINEILNKYRQSSIVDKTLAEEKLDIVYKKLFNAVNGKIITKDNEFYLKLDNLIKPISIHNLSAGLKSFTIIKIMLEKNILKENDILVLDEPEIHIHPKWQLLYAEIIVLIQKVFSLHIVITTHSPYFLEAIEIFTKHYSIENKTNYYLADIKDNYSVMYLVNENTSAIYSKIATPIEDLVDKLGYN